MTFDLRVLRKSCFRKQPLPSASRTTKRFANPLSYKEERRITDDFARSDPFALEGRVAASVLTMLEIRPTTVEQGRLLSHGTVYAQAYDDYLKARGYLQRLCRSG